MLTTFTISNVGDIYTLVNTGPIGITYELILYDSCSDTETSIESGSIDVSGSVDFDLSNNQDGIYKIELSDGIEDGLITIRKYTNLLDTIICDVEYVLCGCGCETSSCACTSCDTCKNQLDVLSKLIAYYSLTYPSYEAFISVVFNEMHCIVTDSLECVLNGNRISGSSDNSLFIKKLISLYYLAFYYGQTKDATTEQLAILVNQFDVVNIFPCITNLGINTDNIKETIDDMATVTFNSAAYVNLPPDNVGDNVVAAANRGTTIITLAMVTTDTTPPYSDPEGDPVDALRVDTLPVNGTLYLNAVAVTPGQIIDVADINANLFTYDSPDQDAIDSSGMVFSLRDTGSGLWSS